MGEEGCANTTWKDAISTLEESSSSGPLRGLTTCRETGQRETVGSDGGEGSDGVRG